MPAEPTHDLAIVGGGPAGASAAIAAARAGLRVVLLERGDFPRDKVCGEFVSHEALPWLQTVVPEIVLASPPIRRAVAVAPSGGRAAWALPQPAAGISRRVLDAALWRAAGGAGVRLRARSPVAAVAPEKGGFRLELAGGEPLHAGAVLVAAGRWWWLRGIGGPAASATAAAGGWVGRNAHFCGWPQGDAVELFAFPGGYCGFAPVEGGRTNVSCLIARRRAGALGAAQDLAAWLQRVAASPALADRLRGGVQCGPTHTTAPVTPGARRAAEAGVLAAGDASGFLDPFTGDGLARAMLSGRLAADALAAGAPGAYAARLARAAAPAYRAAAPLRACVCAPAWVQAAVIGLVGRCGLGPVLHHATRWHA